MATQLCKFNFPKNPTRDCYCTPPQIRRYIAKVFGQLFDRIDIYINILAVKISELVTKENGKSPAEIRRVLSLCGRYGRIGLRLANLCNSQMPPRLIHKYCPLSQSSQQWLKHGIMKFGLSARTWCLETAVQITSPIFRDQVNSYPTLLCP